MINKYLVSFLCLIIGLIGIHFLKNKTRELEQQIEKISKNLNILRENLEIEKVEFSFLSSPIRISELAKKHLPNDYKPIVPKKITHNEK